MHKLILVSLVSVAVFACAENSTAPVDRAEDLLGAALALSQTGLSGTVTLVREVALLEKLPANLALSSEQRARVTQLVDAHASATLADRNALNTIASRAMAAINAGRPRDEIVKILDEAKPIQQRLSAADADLIKNLAGILTPQQSAWLQSQLPPACDRSKFPPLSAAQQKQIAALDSAFAVNNRADNEAARNALLKAAEARAAGKSDAEVSAILDASKTVLDRLAAAAKKLQADIAAVYTPEQKASGCVLLG